MEQYLTRRETAKLLNVTIRTVDRYAVRGILRRVRVGGGKLSKGFLLSDIKEVLEIVNYPQAKVKHY